MATTNITAGFFNLNLKDFLKGALLAVITAPITIITQTLDAGSLKFDWKTIAIVALSAFLSYVVKNLLTPAQIVVTKVEADTMAELKSGDASVKIISSPSAPAATSSKA